MTIPSKSPPRFVLGARVARAWTQLYTRGLEPELRDRRRDELDADLWDQQADARGRGDSDAVMSAVIVLRAMRGAFDDVRWRHEAGVDLSTRRGTPMVVAPKYAHWMALAAIAGAVLSAVIQLLDAGWGLSGTLSRLYGAGWIISLTYLLGLVALHSLHRGSVGRVGSYGFGMLFAGYLVQVVLGAAWLVYAARAMASPPFTGVIALSVLRQILSTVGWVLLGIGIIRARLLPEQFIRLPLMLGCLGILNFATSMIGTVGVPTYSVAAALFSPGSLFRVALNLVYALAVAGLAYAVWSLNRPAGSKSRPAGAVPA